jgi:predicted anti-sigma-YlaC factor YlaD
MRSAAERGGHVQQLLGAYVLGGLQALEEAVVRTHLDRCPPCRAEHDELVSVPSWLDLLTSDNPIPGPEVPGTPAGPP